MKEALWGWPPPVFDPAGPFAEKVTILAWALLGMAGLVTGIVVAALWVALKGPPHLRRRLGGERTVWIGGVVFPAVVLASLLTWGLFLTAQLTEPITGNEPRIRVVGEMWWFRVQYLGPDGEILLNDANEIHLPTGEPVVLELTSADVIHSFWVPHLSGKKDMIPGRTTFLRVQADEPGQFGGVCAEFCGGPHALMGFVAVAHTPSEWKRWLERQRAPMPVDAQPAVVASNLGDARRGRALFMEVGCAACHRVAGTPANGLTGPDLTHVGSRLTLGAGILPNNLGTMMGWIGNSQEIKPGNRMPNYDVMSAEDIASIALWLEQQK